MRVRSYAELCGLYALYALCLHMARSGAGAVPRSWEPGTPVSWWPALKSQVPYAVSQPGPGSGRLVALLVIHAIIRIIHSTLMNLHARALDHTLYVYESAVLVQKREGFMRFSFLSGKSLRATGA